MQNTVVLFSNTDKFVLMQVPYVTGVVLSLAVGPGRLILGVVFWWEGRCRKPRTCFWGYLANWKTVNQNHIHLFVHPSNFSLSVSSELDTELGARDIVVERAEIVFTLLKLIV